jgi:hypothetical protein
MMGFLVWFFNTKNVKASDTGFIFFLPAFKEWIFVVLGVLKKYRIGESENQSCESWYFRFAYFVEPLCFF